MSLPAPITRPALAFALVCALGGTPNAQVRAVGGGCTVPPGGTPGVVETLGEEPVIGNLDFRIAYTCPVDSTAAFVVFGRCVEAARLPMLSQCPCGVSCGQAVDLSAASLAGVDIPRAGRPAIVDLGLPPVAELAGLTICAQFLCFDTSAEPARCREISQGAEIRFEEPGARRASRLTLR